MNANTKRDRLVDSAAELFHTKGLLSTSLADIAKHAEIPIGNVYYYFKTKDELAMAALEKRRQAMNEVYSRLESALDDSRERLIELVRFFDRIKDKYARFGCPIYRLVQDGGEHDKEAVSQAATMVYKDFIAWAQKQFEQLGQNELAARYATTLLAGIQGGIVMARANNSPEVLTTEIERLVEWLSSLPNKRIFLGKAGIKKSDAA